MRICKEAILALSLMTAGAAFAARPLTIDDADPVDTGRFEIEAGAVYGGDSDCDHWDFPVGLGYGVLPGLAVGVGFGGQFEERDEALESGAKKRHRESGVGDLVINAKWQFLEECPLGARHALVPSVKFPTADEDKGLGSGETDYDLMWAASRAFGEKAGVHVNAGYSWIGEPDDEKVHDVVHYGVALDYQLTDAVQWVGEVFAEKELTDGADTVVQYNTGFRWDVVEDLVLDVAGGSKIEGDAPDFTATAGLKWTFGGK